MAKLISDMALSRLRAVSRQAEISCITNTDAQALEVAGLYPEWSDITAGTVLRTGDRVNYEGTLYRVIQEHCKQENWNPVKASSLFTKILIPDPEVIPEWEQPDASNAYAAGDVVTHNDRTWESLTDNNVWEPGAAGTETLWKEI